MVYAPADTLWKYNYGIGDVSTQQPHDILPPSGSTLNTTQLHTACANVLAAWDSNPLSPNDSNDPHLKANSQAIGKGTIAPPFAISNIGTPMPPSADMGAFPTNGDGNQH